MKWGAELGDKEAFRLLVVHARKGKEWERKVLENWFGADRDVLERLKENWETVTFRDGGWRLTPAISD